MSHGRRCTCSFRMPKAADKSTDTEDQICSANEPKGWQANLSFSTSLKGEQRLFRKKSRSCQPYYTPQQAATLPLTSVGGWFLTAQAPPVPTGAGCQQQEQEACKIHCPNNGQDIKDIKNRFSWQWMEDSPWRWNFEGGMQGWWGWGNGTSTGHQNLWLLGNFWTLTPVVFKCCTCEPLCHSSGECVCPCVNTTKRKGSTWLHGSMLRFSLNISGWWPRGVLTLFIMFVTYHFFQLDVLLCNQSCLMWTANVQYWEYWSQSFLSGILRSDKFPDLGYL